MAMGNSVVVDSGSDVTFGLLREFYDQLEAGKQDPSRGLTGLHLRALLEHRNPFDEEQLLAVLPYADEENPSTFAYPAGFQQRSVQDQLLYWRAAVPRCDEHHVEALVAALPPRQEVIDECHVWFPVVHPKPAKLGGAVDAVALAWVAERLAQEQQVRNYLTLDATHHHIHARTSAFHERLNVLPGDYWVFLAQMGLAHRGRSQRRALTVMAHRGEFGLSLYEGGCAMLGNPGRIAPDPLWLDLPGSEYSGDGRQFVGGAFVYWHDGQPRLAAYGVGSVGPCCGSASGLLPQQ